MTDLFSFSKGGGGQHQDRRTARLPSQGAPYSLHRVEQGDVVSKYWSTAWQFARSRRCGALSLLLYGEKLTLISLFHFHFQFILTSLIVSTCFDGSQWKSNISTLNNICWEMNVLIMFFMSGMISWAFFRFSEVISILLTTYWMTQFDL